MDLYPKPVLRLIQSFSKLPGIGKKTAERLTLHLLHAKKNETKILAKALLQILIFPSDFRQKIGMGNVSTNFTYNSNGSLFTSSNIGTAMAVYLIYFKIAEKYGIEKGLSIMLLNFIDIDNLV